MCTWITVRVTTLDDQPHPEMPEEKRFEVPDHFTPEYPVCTCWIGEKEGDGKTLRQTFCETMLQPIFKNISVGKIVIEII